MRKIPLSKKIAFSSILCAISVVILFLGSVIEVIDITTAAFASFVVVTAMIEFGSYYPVLIFFSTSVLSFLLLPNKTVAFMYILFFGYYPILKRYIERLKPAFSFIAKLILFNIIAIAYYCIAKYVLFPGSEQIKLYLILLINVIFFTLDFSITLFVGAYVQRFRKLLRIDRLFK